MALHHIQHSYFLLSQIWALRSSLPGGVESSMHFVPVEKCQLGLAYFHMTPDDPGSESPLKWWTWGGGGGLDCPKEPSVKFFNVPPLKKPHFCMLPNSVGLLLSTVAPKWADLALNFCTQHYAQESHLYVPPQPASVQRMRWSHLQGLYS